MELAIFVTWALSLAALVFSAAYALWSRRRTEGRRMLSALTFFTAGVFVSIWLFLLPQNYSQNYSASDNKAVELIMAVLMSLLNTLQVFINDGSTETLEHVTECAAENISALHTPYTLYAGLLIVAAPILTFGNVLSLFKGFNEEIRFRRSRRRRVFIMSELNNMSVTLAEDIMNKVNAEPLKKVVVFAGVDDAADSELVSKAKEMNAIVLKRAVTELPLTELRNAEVFLIGRDENENITLAADITRNLNECGKRRRNQKMRIFAFSHSWASGRVIDSLKYENLPKVKMPKDENERKKWVKARKYPPPDFRLRRVDIVRLFVWNEVAKMGFSEYDGDVSILIAGFGAYGLEFFKTMSWFCQLYGRRLEINIVDKAADVEAILNRHCPMMTQLNGRLDIEYSVRCFPDVDFDTDSFDRLLNYFGDDPRLREISARLRRTTHAVISLGNDNADIEAALYLRRLFDRIHVPSGKLFEGTAENDYTNEPRIYAVLYDDHLNSDDIISMELFDYKKISYSVSFIGGLSAKYSYKTVCNEELEEKASEYHLGWNDLENNPNNFEGIEQGANKYEELEYFRLSSMSKALYINKNCERLDALREKFPNVKNVISRNEHDRWMLYICSEGYICGRRRDRAKVHPCITKFDELPKKNRRMDDCTEFIKKELNKKRTEE